MNYTKPAISIEDQILRLEQRGLAFGDKQKAAHYLSNISYYRLRAYTYPFQSNTDPNHPFIKPVSFEQIIELYVFDRRLRLLVMDAIEKIEIAFRTKIIYYYAIQHGAYWHEDVKLFHNSARHVKELAKLYEEIDRSSETFIDHYKSKYTVPKYPPAWMSLEVVSLGLLSKFFGNLKYSGTKKHVALEFGIKKIKILENWMHVFASMRNICAHHGRLWNRRLTLQPQLPTDTVYDFVDIRKLYPNKLYATLCCMTYILHIISPGNLFNVRLAELLDSCPLVDFKEMGFPQNWQQESLWEKPNSKG